MLDFERSREQRQTSVFLFLGVYTILVQFRSSAGKKLFLFPSRYNTVADSRYKVVPDHFI